MNSPEFSFEITSEELNFLFEHKKANELALFGGRINLEEKLQTSQITGVDSFTIGARKKHFGSNCIDKCAKKTFISHVLNCLKDKVLLLLLVTGTTSLSLGIYQNFKNNDHSHLYEGISILAVLLVIVLITSINEWKRDEQFHLLNQRKNKRIIKVIRDGKPTVCSSENLVVGDVLIVEPGDIVGGDSVLLTGKDLHCDESELTGESDHVEKNLLKSNVFLYSGSKIVNGTGTALVIAVGEHSTGGKLMSAIQDDDDASFFGCHRTTPLQQKLNKVAGIIAFIGILSSCSMLVILMGKFFFIHWGRWNELLHNLPQSLDIFIQSLSLLAVAVPEGLPLAITLVLAFSTAKMLQENNLVRVLSACETMGSATVICTDKTGTLTTNKMKVVEGLLFESWLDSSFSSLFQLQEEAKMLLAYSISINSSAYETINSETLEFFFVGSKTEVALLNMIKQLGFEYSQIRQESKIVLSKPFSSITKIMETFVEIEDNVSQSVVCYVKGATEVVLAACKFFVDKDQQVKKMNTPMMAKIMDCFSQMTQKSLRTLAIAYKIIKKDQFHAESQGNTNDLVFIGIFGIEDPLRENIKESIIKCLNAGISIKMVTGDNIETAKSIASRCGILSTTGLTIQGAEFRELSNAEQNEIAPRLQLIARSSPLDKKILVQRLREIGEVVAVTGDGSNDGPALKAADVGFSMGICGTEIAKEASSIVLLDDDFASIVKAVKWGRCVAESIRKFLQFLISVNISTVFLTLISSIFNQEPIFSTAQLLWINLIMDTCAALALATDSPSEKLLQRNPEGRKALLVTITMWKMILSQALYQIISILALFYLCTAWGKDRLFVFNTFIWMQLFNMINSRCVRAGEFDIFSGIKQNLILMCIWCGCLVSQVIFVEISGGLSWWKWCISIAFGLGSLGIGLVIRLISASDAAERLVHEALELTEDSLPSGQELWNSALKDARYHLQLYHLLRK